MGPIAPAYTGEESAQIHIEVVIIFFIIIRPCLLIIDEWYNRVCLHVVSRSKTTCKQILAIDDAVRIFIICLHDQRENLGT